MDRKEVAEATARLAEFVASTDYSVLPPAVVQQAKLIAADTVGVCLRGSLEPEMQQLYGRLPAGHGATVLKSGMPQADPAWAAFANATGGCFLEMDEGARPAGHPGIHVVPPTLAAAQVMGKSGPEYLAALVVGYEVQNRISRACRMRPGTHPHGNMGHPAAAVALGKLSGWNAEQMRQGINVAAGITTATAMQPCLDGATVRNSYPGMTAQTAFTVRLMVESGFTGQEDALAETFGRILGQEFNAAALTEELGTRYAVTNNFFKFHAACYFNHPVLDAVADAIGATIHRGEYPPLPAPTDRPRPEEIRRVRVRMLERYAILTGLPRPNQLSAKFSIPFAVASYLVRGDTHPDSFRGEALEDGRIWDLAKRVELVGDPAMNAFWPAEIRTEAELELEDGRVLKGSCSNPFGAAANPPEVPDLFAKFRAMTGSVLADDDREVLWSGMLGLEKQTDMGRFPFFA